MIPPQQAVREGLRIYGDLFPGAYNQDVRLEEVVWDDGKSQWRIAVSFQNPDFKENGSEEQNPNDLAALMRGAHGPKRRYYKQIRLDESGKFVAVTNQ